MDLWIESRGLGGAMVHDVGLFAYPGMFFAFSFLFLLSFKFFLLSERGEGQNSWVQDCYIDKIVNFSTVEYDGKATTS